MFLRAASLSTKTKQHKLDRLRPPSPWTNDLADEGVAVFVVQASRFTNMAEIINNYLLSISLFM
jgi:hypothetical protein